jgi:hypothetical protein
MAGSGTGTPVAAVGTDTLGGLKTYCRTNGWLDETDGGLTQLGAYINDTINQLAREFAWPWYRKPAYFNTKGPYSTGTVDLTSESTTVTGAGSADFDSGMVDQEFYCGSDGGRVYQISAVAASAETLTLASAYLGDTESGATYSIRYIKYSLPDDFDRASVFRLEDERDLDSSMTLEEWQADRMAHRGTTSTPTRLCVQTATNAGFYVSPAPSSAKQVRYVYQAKPAWMSSDSEVCDWPTTYRYLLHATLVKRMAEDDADVSLLLARDREFARLLHRAFEAARPTQAPLRINLGNRTAVSPEAYASHFNIIE